MLNRTSLSRKLAAMVVVPIAGLVLFAMMGFYFLGKIHENQGEMDKAREYYRRFYEYWKDGDMDREQVEEAKKKLDTI